MCDGEAANIKPRFSPQVARHFQSVDSRYSQVSLGADYTMESHGRDHESYAAVTRGRRRRAKALLDFERHDDDELGFRKNDVITGEICSSGLVCLKVSENLRLCLSYYYPVFRIGTGNESGNKRL